jgi:hypothetical protein
MDMFVLHKFLSFLRLAFIHFRKLPIQIQKCNNPRFTRIYFQDRPNRPVCINGIPIPDRPVLYGIRSRPDPTRYIESKTRTDPDRPVDSPNTGTCDRTYTPLWR